MYSVFNIIKNLEEHSSLNEKRNILQMNKNNENLKKFFKYALDPTYVFGVKKLDYDIVYVENDVFSFDTIIDICNRLLSNKRNIKTYLPEALSSLTEEEYYILWRILKKDPSCGVSVALVNETWPNHIDFGVKLCKAEPFSKKLLDKHIKFPAIVQTKEDGARCIAFYNSITGKCEELRSSSGNEFTKMNHIQAEIESRAMKIDIEEEYEKGYYIDGELIVLDDNGNYLPRKLGNGILNKSIRETITDVEASKVVFVIWDCIPYNEYNCVNTDFKKVPYLSRLSVCKFLSQNNESVKLIESSFVNSINEASTEFKTRLSKGQEGIILKNCNFIWDGKRLKEQLKYKLDLDVTLKVVDWAYGATGTKYETCLGSLICESSDGLIHVRVGSGMSDLFRKQFMKRDNKVGWFIEVRSNGIITTENDMNSLFLPRMIEERLDKTNADDYKTICSLQEAKTSLIQG